MHISFALSRSEVKSSPDTIIATRLAHCYYTTHRLFRSFHLSFLPFIYIYILLSLCAFFNRSPAFGVLFLALQQMRRSPAMPLPKERLRFDVLRMHIQMYYTFGVYCSLSTFSTQTEVSLNPPDSCKCTHTVAKGPLGIHSIILFVKEETYSIVVFHQFLLHRTGYVCGNLLDLQ